MNVVVERCAFLDVHRDTVMACARTPDGTGGRREEVVEFGTTVSQLTALGAWLNQRAVTLVGMEATGVYWKPVHWVLEDEIDEIWVINARHMRNVPGRKTDVADAQWGAQLLEHGLVRPSFIPERKTREQRDLSVPGAMNSEGGPAKCTRWRDYSVPCCHDFLRRASALPELRLVFIGSGRNSSGAADYVARRLPGAPVSMPAEGLPEPTLGSQVDPKCVPEPGSGGASEGWY